MRTQLRSQSVEIPIDEDTPADDEARPPDCVDAAAETVAHAVKPFPLTTTGPDGVDRYFVRRHGGVWRIHHDGHAAGDWTEASEAVAYACRLARESAALGYPSEVVSDLDPDHPQVFPARTSETPTIFFLRPRSPDTRRD